MNLPERDMALAWVGRTVVDRDGAEIGACTAVFTDDATELAEWVCSKFDGTTVFIPAVGAAETDGMVQVVIAREDVAGAPTVGGPEHISGDEEVALYRHYGIPHSRDASPTVLPTGDAVPAADSTGSGDSVGRAESAGSGDSVGSGDYGSVPESAPAGAVPESVGTPRAVASESDTRPDSAGGPPSKGRGRILLAAGGASALAVAAGAVLQARRRRQRSLAARLEATTRVVRQRKTGAAAITSALTGAAIAARRRRRSRNTEEIRVVQDTPSY